MSENCHYNPHSQNLQSHYQHEWLPANCSHPGDYEMLWEVLSHIKAYIPPDLNKHQFAYNRGPQTFYYEGLKIKLDWGKRCITEL